MVRGQTWTNHRYTLCQFLRVRVLGPLNCFGCFHKTSGPPCSKKHERLVFDDSGTLGADFCASQGVMHGYATHGVCKATAFKKTWCYYNMLNTFKTTVVSFFPGRLRVSIGDCTPSWSVSGNFSLSFFPPCLQKQFRCCCFDLAWLSILACITVAFVCCLNLVDHYHHSVGRNNTNRTIYFPNVLLMCVCRIVLWKYLSRTWKSVQHPYISPSGKNQNHADSIT